MRVVELQGYGGPEQLRLVERPEPEPDGERVRVRVAATAVNPVDLSTRAGVFASYLAERPADAPGYVLGWDFAGVTDDGRRVAGLVPWMARGGDTGTYGEYLLAEPGWLAPLPDGVDPADAATLALNGQTAQQALALLELRAGQRLLVTGASGGVGQFAVQLGAAAGAEVTAVASRGDEEYVAGLGAATVLDRHAELPAGAYDAVFNTAAPKTAIAAARDGGAYVAATMPAAAEPERGIRSATVFVSPDAGGLADLLDRLAAGTLRTRVAERLPLSAAAEAHARAEAGGFRGKLMLLP
ncbi:NADP-dependent oxidoreductase [Dactylosporangium sp. AC04546]|uniref:NADP-dependent oxidoreductase n=1 Tax=Dactylosporangium sp. AC04546 TaxID=2862460 RepID=UPI001EE10C59|nr:NADP-dependent oxidoreductase [Dactylosporangium sp. AC04546]WVK87747.1 NADP-dependent oxidoreductase [Dactylosporangium sp. AC04546]